jgi:hypothetical protein
MKTNRHLRIVERDENNIGSTRNPDSDCSDRHPHFRHSPDFRSVVLSGKQYILTRLQAAVVRVLYEAYLHGTPVLSYEGILGQIGSNSANLRDIFKSNPDAWRELLVRERKGTCRLNL